MATQKKRSVWRFYVCLDELKRHAELDLYFELKTIGEIEKEHQNRLSILKSGEITKTMPKNAYDYYEAQ